MGGFGRQQIDFAVSDLYGPYPMNNCGKDVFVRKSERQPFLIIVISNDSSTLPVRPYRIFFLSEILCSIFMSNSCFSIAVASESC